MCSSIWLTKAWLIQRLFIIRKNKNDKKHFGTKNESGCTEKEYWKMMQMTSENIKSQIKNIPTHKIR